MQPTLQTQPSSSLPALITGGGKRRAAGIMFRAPGDRALFVKRSKIGDHEGEWAFPGGMVEEGEATDTAARREAVEELGTIPSWHLDHHSTSEDDNLQFTTYRQDVEREFEPFLNNEHDEFVWAPINTPPRPLHPGVYRLLRAQAVEPSVFETGFETGTWDSAEVFIDREHDGPWMSCMSRDGRVMYVNSSLPALAMIGDTEVDVAEVLLRHEVPEWRDLERLLIDFKLENNQDDPSTADRAKIYRKAHRRSGVPGEREFCERHGVDWKQWNAWCRGEESRIEKGPFENEPEDADVKPIPHSHGELAATDSALVIAFDRESVRSMDPDGRMRVAMTNISKANICPYRGAEIPDFEELGLDPDKIYQLLRDPDELKKAAPSFNGVQILRKHTPVSADDHQPYEVVGSTGTDASFEDPYLRNSLSIWSQEAVDDIESGRKRELSCGYHYRPDMTPGTFDGMPYDGVMRDIVGNHVALVEDGRAGPDVVVGDSSEGLMNIQSILARQSSMTAIARYLRPRMAQDAKPVDLAAVFEGIKTGPSFKKSKIKIAERLRAQAKGKLARDATLEDVEKILDMLDGHEIESADESVSKEQHNAMAAAAHGHSNIGIPKDVGQEFLDADKGKQMDHGDPYTPTFDNDVLPFLKEKGMSEDDIEHLRGMFPKPATDEFPPKEGEGEKAAEEKAKGGEAVEPSKALDPNRPNGDKRMAGDSVTKHAMDAAIAVASKKTAERVRAEVRSEQRAIRQAEDFVRPWVGQLAVDLAFDSADDVYRQAAKMLGIDEAASKDFPAAALPAIIKRMPKPGEVERRGFSPIGQDADSMDELEKDFPGIGRIGVM